MLVTREEIVQGIPDGLAIIASMHVLASPSTIIILVQNYQKNHNTCSRKEQTNPHVKYFLHFREANLTNYNVRLQLILTFFV
jgi:hypothetical protein